MTELRIPSDREPVVDPATGRCTRSWYLFFGGILARLGGVIGPGNEASDLFSGAEGSAELSAAMYQLAQEFAQAPPFVPPATADFVNAEIQALRDQIAELTKEIQGIRSGQILL